MPVRRSGFGPEPVARSWEHLYRKWLGMKRWKVWEQTPPRSPAPGVHSRCYLGLFFGGETLDITSRPLPQRPSGPTPILLTKLRHAADTYLERRSPAQA